MTTASRSRLKPLPKANCQTSRGGKPLVGSNTFASACARPNPHSWLLSLPAASPHGLWSRTTVEHYALATGAAIEDIMRAEDQRTDDAAVALVCALTPDASAKLVEDLSADAREAHTAWNAILEGEKKPVDLSGWATSTGAQPGAQIPPTTARATASSPPPPCADDNRFNTELPPTRMKTFATAYGSSTLTHATVSEPTAGMS